MPNNPKLWIFGDSLSTGYNLSDESRSWPHIVAKKLKLDLMSYASPAVDNFYIYQSAKGFWNQIDKNDVVVVGWTHPNRKTFVLDRKNTAHTEVEKSSLKYIIHEHEFFRYDGTHRPKKPPFQTLPLVKSGIDYFDCWFDRYFHEYEQNCNFQSYVDSTICRIPSLVSFFFSSESVARIITPDDDPLFVLDYIRDNQFFISNDDNHFNVDGHQHWAEKILNKILTLGE